MPDYDQKNAECLVFTFKDGLLSKIAHDLKLRVTRFRVSVDLSRPFVAVELDASSLVVETAMHAGTENPGALSATDRDKIASQMRADVLQVSSYPRINFSSTRALRRADGGYDLSGTLALHGVERELSVQTRVEGNQQVAEVGVHQPDYGITVFKAMLGTLKIKPDVRVRLSVPVE